MEKNDQSISVEWVLIALLSVFAFSSVISILLSYGVITINTDLSVAGLISEGFYIGPIKGSAYWLAGVGAIWFIAHRLGLRRWWALVIIGAAVSVGITLVFSGAHFSLFWFVMNALVSSILGWVLWRLAYRQPVPDAGPRLNPGEYQTTIGRSLLALFCGGLAGAGVTMVILMIIFEGFSFADFEEILVLALGFWLGGGFVLGGISIVVLHSIGLRQWYGMTIVGGLIMLVIGLVALGGISDIAVALIMAGVGSVAGWIIWRVAYRRAPLER